MTTRRRASGPLLGVRVLELATVVAGPTAGGILADLGADVIKIEPPGGDTSRHVGASKGKVSLWWKYLGRNKRSIAIDLNTEKGRELVLQLVATADVLIESFRPGTLERWNLSPELLLEHFPHLVIARITGYGRTGPYADQPAFGTLIEAMSGFADINGAFDGPPTLPPVALADYLTGYATTIAVLASLRARDSGGAGGQVADINLLSPLLSMLNLQIIQTDQTGVCPTRIGSRMVTTSPRNVYITADNKWVAVSGTSAKMASQLLELAGRPDLCENEWFSTGGGRFAHVDEIDRAMQDWTSKHSLAEILNAARAVGATLGPVNDISQLLHDEQIAANGMLAEIEDPDLGIVSVPNLLFNLEQTPGLIEWLGEELGASTDDVLGELNLSDSEIATLKATGVVR